MLHGWVDRPVEGESNQIETLIENNQCYTMWEIADILKITKSIKFLVKMKNVFYFTEKTKWTLWTTKKSKIYSNFQLFSSIGSQSTKILQHTKNYIFCQSDKKQL